MSGGPGLKPLAGATQALREKGFAQRVVRWQGQHGRHGLPWQRCRDPYRVWLSEVMLQQTQVATVLGYYERFLARFPTVLDLAAAQQDEVLALWSGLGYYSRARNLHRCAQAVATLHGGVFPASAASLATLPGIGRSTAAAIAAFCFHERVAILDGNVKRVLSRLLAFDEDLNQASAQRALWQAAEALLPEQASEAVAHYTQALMDLGATVCAPRAPRCGQCPVADLCLAKLGGEPQRLPVKTRRLRRRHQSLYWLAWVWQGRLWWVQRPDSGIWARLWSLPQWDDEVERAGALHAWPGRTQHLPPLAHALTHIDLTLHLCVHEIPGEVDPNPWLAQRYPEGAWYNRNEALGLGLPAPLRKWLQQTDL